MSLYINGNVDIRHSKSGINYGKHNLRLYSNHKNKDIDNAKSNQNVLVRLNDCKKNRRKNGIEKFNFVYSIKTDDADFLESNELLVQFFNDFKNEFFSDNKANYYAIHNDETNPHIHFEISAYNDKEQKGTAREYCKKSFYYAVKNGEQAGVQQKIAENQNIKGREPSEELKKIRETNKNLRKNIEKMKAVAELQKQDTLQEMNEREKIEQEKQELKLYMTDIETSQKRAINNMNYGKEQVAEIEQIVQQEQKLEQEVQEVQVQEQKSKSSKNDFSMR